MGSVENTMTGMFQTACIFTHKRNSSHATIPEMAESRVKKMPTVVISEVLGLRAVVFWSVVFWSWEDGK
jgi:hypothetical protein